MSSFFDTLRDLIYVPKCCACFSVIEDGRKALCEKCYNRYKAELTQRCPSCERMYAYCSCRLHYSGRSYPMIHVTAYSISRISVSKNLVLHVKDDRLDAAFDHMAGEMVNIFRYRASHDMQEELSVFSPENTYVTWIPRSDKAKRKAGHDQSRELALRIGKQLCFEAVEMFENIGSSAQKTLDRKSRMENAKVNYHLVKDSSFLKGKNVLLIDDIITSGATLGVSAEALRRAGVKNVAALVFAKTDTKKGMTEETYFYSIDH